MKEQRERGRVAYDFAAMLRLMSYLAPSIPAEFFELAAKAISDGSGIEVDLQFEQRISGPLPGDVNPFETGAVDVGFVCSPTFRWLADELDLLPVPVPSDNRAHGRPVYFADVIVRAESPYLTMKDLRGRRWAYNDRNSRSGWFSMIDRIAPLAPHEFFSDVVHAGSHLESIRLVRTGQVDAAAIDSNALLNESRLRAATAAELRIIESWGPFPIQPVVIRRGIQIPLKASIHRALLQAHLVFGERLRALGFVSFVEAERIAYEA